MGKTYRRRDEYEDDDYSRKTKKMQDRRGERLKKQNERDSYASYDKEDDNEE